MINVMNYNSSENAQFANDSLKKDYSRASFMCKFKPTPIT